MTGDRLTGPEKRALLIWVFLGVAGVVFAQRYFFRAFPEAAVDFRVSREEALARAKKFVGGLGENVNGYQSTIVFDVDDNAKTYLEREVGLQQANRLMSSELNIWYWDVRFFRPQQEEEFRVRVNPAGQVVGYAHKIEEARAGAALEMAAAQGAAQLFLSAKLGVDLSKWDFLAEEANSKKRPNRTDWSFTWEKREFRAKDAPYRLRVNIEGDRAGGAEEFLKVPEAWERGYQRLRSSNNTLTAVFLLPYLLLIGAAVWLAITLTRAGQTTWGGAIKLGIIVAVLLFLQALNDWPLWAAGYDTKDSYGSFLASKIALSFLLAIVTAALTVTPIIPSADSLYRATQPGRLRLAKAFTWRGMRTKEFFSATVVGLSLAAVHIGYLVAFYIVAGHFGSWAPQELNYENSVSTAFPWISGAAIGVTAATSEEFLFRLFAIPFLQRLTRSRWIAVIVPAFLWSFLHSNYPQEPPYIRGIEIGLIGVVAGIVMLRWGILATLIWHYTVDASLVGLGLVRASSLYLNISGVVVGGAALVPLIIAGVYYLRRGQFEPAEDLVNGAEPKPEISFTSAPSAAAASAAVRRYEALTPGAIAFLAVCLVFGGLAAWRLKIPSFGDYLKLTVDARTVRAHADDILHQRGVDPNSYRHVTVLVDVTDPYVNEFLRQRVGVAGLNEICAKQVPGALWRARYFRDSQPEEYAVILKPDGSLHSVRHKLAEDAPGASLGKEEALPRAEKFLREKKKIDLRQWSLVEATSEKRPRRIDHKLTWEQNAALDSVVNVAVADSANHAHVRLDVEILGDEAANYRTYIKIPDEWRRKQEEKSLARTIFNYALPALLFGGFGITALVVFLMNLRTEPARSIPWRRVGLWSACGLAGFVLTFALGSAIPGFLNTYDTAIPLKAMYAGLAIGAVIGGAFHFGAVALLFGLAWYYASRAFGEERLPAGGNMPGTYYRDALWIGLCGTTALIGLNRVIEAALAHWPTVHRSFEPAFDSNLDAILPFGSIVGGTVSSALLLTGCVAAIASFIAAVLKPWWLRSALFMLGTLFLAGHNWGSPADFAKQVVAHGVLLGVLTFGVSRITRFNLLGCFLVVAGSALLEAATELLSQMNGYYRANGYAVVVLLVMVLSWPFLAWRLHRTQRSGSPGANAV